MSESRSAISLNARMKPLPEGYPFEEVPCECEGKKSCLVCSGKGKYYYYKRIKGQWLPDEGSSVGELGEKPNW